MTRPLEVPGNRPCAVCDRPMNENRRHWFADYPDKDMRCICSWCANAGWQFDPRGAVALLPTALQRARLEATP